MKILVKLMICKKKIKKKYNNISNQLKIWKMKNLKIWIKFLIQKINQRICKNQTMNKSINKIHKIQKKQKIQKNKQKNKKTKLKI